MKVKLKKRDSEIENEREREGESENERDIFDIELKEMTNVTINRVQIKRNYI